MNIAVMVSLSPASANSACRSFFNHALYHLVSQQPQHHYYICTDAPQEVVVKAGNVTTVLAPYINTSKQLFPLWQQVKYSRLLKKLDVRLILCLGARLFIKTPLPYCLMIDPADVSKMSSRSFKKVISHARSLLTFSQTAKTSICEQYKIPAEKVGIVHPAALDIFKTADPDSGPAAKEQYTNGREYFIYTGSFEEHASLIDLLKAFSIFKKRQKTSWKLVLVNLESGQSLKLTEALRTYKYREDVVVLQHVEENNLPDLLAAAYAFIYPQVQADCGLYILGAMQCGLPILAIHHREIEEIAGDAALYYNGTVNDLAEKIMTLYKHEASRGLQISKANKIIQNYSWQKTAEEILWGIETANS